LIAAFLKIALCTDIKCNFCSFTKSECTCNRFKYNRLCHCCNVVEDEAHFLLNCTIYDQTRADFLKCISEFIVFDSTLDDDQRFIILMNNLYGDPELASFVCDYVEKCFTLRKSYLEPFEINNDENVKQATRTQFGRPTRAPCRLIEQC